VLGLLLALCSADRMAVIPLVEGPGDVSASLVFDAIAAEVEWRPTIELATEGALVVSPFVRCGADESCIADELRSGQIDIGLVVVVNTEVAPGLVSMRAIDAASASTRAKGSGSLGAEGAEVLRRLASKLLDELGHREAAKLRIVSEAAIEALAIEPPPLKQIAPDRFFVAPGAHTIEAIGATKITIEARAGAETEVHLTPVASPSIVESPWLWIAVGGAAIAAGAVTAAIVLAQPNDLCVCLGRPGDPCPDC
jgi:hypothetical protein